MVVGAPQVNRAQHGVGRLGPIGHELGEIARGAVDPRTAVPGVGGQQLLQQQSPGCVIAVRIASSTAAKPWPQAPQ